jgi:hypothetical protein
MAIEEAARESPLPDLTLERTRRSGGEILVFEETFEARTARMRPRQGAYFAHPWQAVCDRDRLASSRHAPAHHEPDISARATKSG